MDRDNRELYSSNFFRIFPKPSLPLDLPLSIDPFPIYHRRCSLLPPIVTLQIPNPLASSTSPSPAATSASSSSPSPMNMPLPSTTTWSLPCSGDPEPADRGTRRCSALPSGSRNPSTTKVRGTTWRRWRRRRRRSGAKRTLRFEEADDEASRVETWTVGSDAAFIVQHRVDNMIWEKRSDDSERNSGNPRLLVWKELQNWRKGFIMQKLLPNGKCTFDFCQIHCMFGYFVNIILSVLTFWLIYLQLKGKSELELGADIEIFTGQHWFWVDNDSLATWHESASLM